MKKIALFTAIAAGSLAIAACGAKKDEAAPVAEDSAAAPVADTSAAASDDAGMATDAAAAASEPAKM